MGIVLVVGVIVLVVAAVCAALLVLRRRRRPAAPARGFDAPPTALDDALRRATDDTGTTIGDQLESLTGSIDELRTGDDDSLLGRALDRAEQAARGAPDGERGSGDYLDRPPPG